MIIQQVWITPRDIFYPPLLTNIVNNFVDKILLSLVAENFLYLDESGDQGNPIDGNGKRVLRSSTHFAIGGIIVNSEQKLFFETRHKEILKKYFLGITLPSNFKLHYNPLRMREFPYSELSRNNMLKLEEEIYDIIRKSNCTLLSFIINLVGHYQFYSLRPVNPLAYGLICIIERYRYYLVDNNISSGKIIYENFTRSLGDMVYKEAKYLKEKTRFRANVDLKKLRSYIYSRKPQEELVLQFADFWAYIPFRRESSNYDLKTWKNQIYNYGKDKKKGYVNFKYDEEDGP